MRVTRIDRHDRLDARRGDIVVCVIVGGEDELLSGCLLSVLAHTRRDVPILVCDEATGASPCLDAVRKLAQVSESSHALFYLQREPNDGLPSGVNCAVAITAPADVVLLNPSCVVASGWLEGMQHAAYGDSTAASATALSHEGGDPGREGLARVSSFDDAAARVRSSSLRLRPRLPAASGACLYVRRSALELVGDFDPTFLPGCGEEDRFSRRCIQSGLSHVLADDVLVSLEGHGAGSAAWYSLRLPDGEAGPLLRSTARVRRALAGLSVAVDALILGGPITGTHVHVLELIAALSRREDVRLSVIVPNELGRDAANALSSLPRVSLVRYEEARASFGEIADVVHRPFQVNNPGDVTFLGAIGNRLILTQQDLIAYHNPHYFPAPEAWSEYRRLTRWALASVDRVVFLSAHARDDAIAEELVEPARASIVPIGVDHHLVRSDLEPAAPRGAEHLADRAEAILCLGTDFHHKNRTFALHLLESMRRRHGWEGYLLFAGPAVPHGSSRADEAALLGLHPRLREAVVDFGAVNEAEKKWLFRRARLVLYPTVSEGFGLVPFEAAEHGVPCMWARGTSLSEVLPDEAAEIVPWDAEQSADRALTLLRDARARERNLALVGVAAERLTWDTTAARLVELYDETSTAPAAPASVLGPRHGLVTGPVSEDAMRLVGPGGELPAAVERPLLALATHPKFGAPLFGVLKLGYRASYTLRRRSGRRQAPPRSRGSTANRDSAVHVRRGRGITRVTLPTTVRSRVPDRLRDAPRVRAAALAVGLIPPRVMHSHAEARLLADLARQAGCVVELGVYEGSSALVFCDALPACAELHLVDPFPAESGAALLPGWRGSPLAAQLVVWRGARGIGPQVFWHIERSQDVGRVWDGPPVDLVFVDGDHSATACREDWEVWHPHVRSGGAIAFHDARLGRPDGDGSPGPTGVVDELFRGTRAPAGWHIARELDTLVVVQRDESAVDSPIPGRPSRDRAAPVDHHNRR